MEEIAFAKLNLALHVRGREADGYHRIETIFAFCEDGDRLSVAPGDGITLKATGPFAGDLGEGEDNLVLKAAHALTAACDMGRGVRLTLDKRLPVAAGIGGGSADAAAALRLLARWWSLDDPPLQAIASDLGADVPACLASTAMIGTGRGDRLEPAALGLAGTPVLLINPRMQLATAEVFRAWDGIDRGPLGEWRIGRNDLEEPARRLAPQIGEVLAALAGAPFARMSGSGATCFALYDSEAERDAADAALSRGHPSWWTLRSRLRS